jgi:site-specific DNA-methyltransferase (adenine-specific)
LVEADPLTVEIVPTETVVGPVANDCDALLAEIDPAEVLPGLPYRASTAPVVLLEGDNLALLKTLDENSVHSVVTDPPYGLKFMGKSWDHDVPTVDFWREVYRVLKPGGYVLSFSGTRTYHRMTVAIEDAGFDIVDQISWLYGQGFPKSRNVSKDIDRILGGKREVVGRVKECGYDKTKAKLGVQTHNVHEYDVLSDDPITEEAERFQGYGTALKPAQEPICVARKPHKGSIAKNVLEHGVGALNIDACRVGTDGGTTRSHQGEYGVAGRGKSWRSGHETVKLEAGRWPANVIHDGSEAVMATFPHTKTGRGKKNAKGGYSEGWGERGDELSLNGGDEGSAARYFYCAKPSKAEKGDTSHVTVKPVALMRYLVRLVTPAGGTVLDPFAGSGTTGIAAAQEGFCAILMERDATYAEDIRRRVPLAA